VVDGGQDGEGLFAGKKDSFGMAHGGSQNRSQERRILPRRAGIFHEMITWAELRHFSCAICILWDNIPHLLVAIPYFDHCIRFLRADRRSPAGPRARGAPDAGQGNHPAHGH
jgi:hypothetical protein